MLLFCAGVLLGFGACIGISLMFAGGQDEPKPETAPVHMPDDMEHIVFRDNVLWCSPPSNRYH